MYPLYHFYAIFSVCSDLQGGSRITIWGDSLKRFQGCGVLNMTGSGYSQIFCALYRRSCASNPKTFPRCKNVFEVVYHHASFCWRLDFACRRENQKCWFFCLCVCRSRSLTTKFERTTLPRRRWNLEVIFISLDMGSTEHFQRLFCN